jgi:hypothetical protein
MLDGTLPVFEIGDRWVTKSIVDGVEYTMISEVTGEEVYADKECYVMEQLYDPPLAGVLSSVTAKINKETLFLAWKRALGENLGISVTITYRYTIRFIGGRPSPLAVGREFEIVETKITSSSAMGETETEKTTCAYIYKVEKIEQITVPAGTFRCFKMDEYNKQGTLLNTRWLSPEVKMGNVKQLKHAEGIVTELVSYSSWSESRPSISALRLSVAEDYVNEGKVLSEEGRLEEAVSKFNEAIRLDPQYARAYYNRGNAYGDLGQYQRAVEDYTEAISLDPQFAKAYYNRAGAYTVLGRDQEAERDIEKAVELGVDADALRKWVEELKAQR